MIWNPPIRSAYDPPASSWSNRILLLATAGILFLTLYPFRFNFHLLPHGASPFFLGKSQKSGVADALLNVLLFVPFGFGLAERLREGGKSRRFVLITALACGALFSYTIEFFQLYIPERDSGWEDVFTNASGSLIGSILYFFVGDSIVRTLCSVQRFLVAWLTPVRITYVLLVYFCCWFVIASVLQRQSSLSNWKPDATLMLGNDASGQNPWRGEIQTLQIWNHASRLDKGVSQLTGATIAMQPDTPIVDYDFSMLRNSTAPLQFDPKLFWIPGVPDEQEVRGAAFNGKSWLSTKTNVPDLVENLRKTNQFTIHLVCTPDDVADAWGRIVYISDYDLIADVMVRQETTGLGFGFNTPLASKHAQLIWSVPGVFSDHRQRDILYSYDGSNLTLTLDGQKRRLTYKLGPGTALARLIHRVKPAELEGNNYIFYTMIFFVGGVLLGLSALYQGPRVNLRLVLSSFLALCVIAVALEFILVSVSGRAVSTGYVVLSVALGVAGVLWGLADNHFRANSRSLPG